MHEQICLIHVLFDQLLVLLGVPTSDDKVVLTGDEPDEFLKPENLPVDGLIRFFLKLL